jgi:hypothetical protein
MALRNGTTLSAVFFSFCSLLAFSNSLRARCCFHRFFLLSRNTVSRKQHQEDCQRQTGLRERSSSAPMKED